MKKALFAVVIIPVLCAVGLAIHCETQAKKQDRAEWKKINDNLDDSMRSITEGLKNLPKIGE